MFKISSLNGISIILKFCIGFITSKFIALFVGPSGMALVGNMRNFLASTEAFASLGFENGVVKYVASHKEDEIELKKTLSTVFITVFAVCFCVAITLFCFSEYFNRSIFGLQNQYGFVFKVLALVLPFYIGNIFLVATINGLGNFKKVIYINIIGSCIGLLVSLILIYQLKTEGAILSIIATPSLLFLISFFFINKEINILSNINFKFYDFKSLHNLSSYSLMALVSSVFGPMVFIAIRKYIILNLSLVDAGFWEAISRISSYYFMFITSILSIYFLPKLSISKNYKDTSAILWSFYKGVFPIFVIALIMLFFLRDIAIQLIFTKQFLPVTKLFFWQMVGDIFKAASYVLAFLFYAKRLTKAFIISEIGSLLLLYFSSLFFIHKFGIEGVVMAHALTYFIYFIVLSLYFRKYLAI
ncbi:MAG: O-antigen translocase [Flavobacterium sp.]|nr:O-antigen translocase [Flavobacterium sp.]